MNVKAAHRQVNTLITWQFCVPVSSLPPVQSAVVPSSSPEPCDVSRAFSAKFNATLCQDITGDHHWVLQRANNHDNGPGTPPPPIAPTWQFWGETVSSSELNGLALSLSSSKSTFSQPSTEKCTREVVGIGTIIILHSEKAMKTHVLHADLLKGLVTVEWIIMCLPLVHFVTKPLSRSKAWVDFTLYKPSSFSNGNRYIPLLNSSGRYQLEVNP